jgi:hypothetical protein
MVSMLESALFYLEKLGYSIIPIDQEKIARIKWDPYKENKPTREEVVSWWSKWPDANIGIVTGKVSGIIVFDLDLYKVSKDQQEYLWTLFPDRNDFPNVKTPRGGFHIYSKYPDTDEHISGFRGKKNTRLDGLDLRADLNYVAAPPSKNGNGKAYEWTNDQSLFDLKVFSTIGFNSILNIYNSTIYRGTQETVTSVTDRYLCYSDGYRGESLFSVANGLSKGRIAKPDANYIVELLAKNCDPPYDLSKVAKIIESAYDRGKKREQGVLVEVEEFVSVTSGYYSVTEAALALPALQRGSIRQAMARLVEKGVIERDPKIDGRFRKIDKNIEEVNWIDIEVKEIPVKYPFSIHEQFVTMPKNIIIISGTSNAGKSAFLLDFVNKNMEKFKGKIHYFSSEMGAMELKARILNFGYDLDFWKGKFKFYERAGNFSDIIKPDEINIIDYLDVTDEFWKVGTYIKDIFDKLNNGIALIAIQKNPEKEYGRGGAMSIEKARLYISIDPGKVKLVKAKNWRTDINPNGLFKEFKLVKGCSFREIGNGWKKAEKDYDNKTYQREPGED